MPDGADEQAHRPLLSGEDISTAARTADLRVSARAMHPDHFFHHFFLDRALVFIPWSSSAPIFAATRTVMIIERKTQYIAHVTCELPKNGSFKYSADSTTGGSSLGLILNNK
jgi:hypothetical protein